MNKNMQIYTAANELAAEQCGAASKAGIHLTYKRQRERKETTSKSRTAAASGTLAATMEEHHEFKNNRYENTEFTIYSFTFLHVYLLLGQRQGQWKRL